MAADQRRETGFQFFSLSLSKDIIEDRIRHPPDITPCKPLTVPSTSQAQGLGDFPPPATLSKDSLSCAGAHITILVPSPILYQESSEDDGGKGNTREVPDYFMCGHYYGSRD